MPHLSPWLGLGLADPNQTRTLTLTLTLTLSLTLTLTLTPTPTLTLTLTLTLTITRARDAASLIAAHRKGARQRQSLLQEAEEASLRASRLTALVGAKVRVRVGVMV